LHLVTGAQPPAAVLPKLALLVRVKVAGAQRPTDLLQVRGQACDHRLRHPPVGVSGCARLHPVVLDVAPDLLDRRRRRLWPCHALPPMRFRLSPAPPERGDTQPYCDLSKAPSASASSLAEPYRSAAAFDRHFRQIASRAGGTAPLSART